MRPIPKLRGLPGALLCAAWTAGAALLVCAITPAAAQIETRFGNVAAEEELPRYDLLEVQEILVANGIEVEIAETYLARFAPERTFTDVEIEVMVVLLRPAEGVIVPGEEELLPGGARPEIEGLPIFPEEVLPEEYEPRILKPYGYDLFRSVALPAVPPEDISVGPDYVVGIGDEILITLWGDVEKRYAKVIDRQGRLVLPEIGVVTVAGTTLGELRQELEALYGQIYRNFRMTVSLGDVRTIQVYVSGDVRKPGSYTLSALSTAFTALYYAGGPTLKGSLRAITLSRRGAPFQTIDLYSFLLAGDRSMDLPVQSGDVVHVQPLGGTVKIYGEVRRPGIYEIREGEALRDAIRIAGGLTALSFPSKITLDRFSETSGTQVFKIDWADLRQNPSLRGGDEITVFSVHQVHPREFVEIHGRVQRPGTYRLVPGMCIADLLFRAGGTLEGAYLERAELARPIETLRDSLVEMQLLDIPLREVLGDERHPGNLPLRRGDKVFVRTAPGWHPPPVVALRGEVRFPGKYGLAGLSERIGELLDRAGGLTTEAFPRGAQVFRGEEGRIIIDFSKALHDPRSSDNIALEDGDSVYVPRRPETIRVSGGVANPGLLLYTPGKKAGYYIEKTGGLTEKANPSRVKIVRVTGEVELARRRFWSDRKVREGDEIFVELREESKPIDWGKTLREATTIIASLATTVYVISNLNN